MVGPVELRADWGAGGVCVDMDAFLGVGGSVEVS